MLKAHHPLSTILIILSSKHTRNAETLTLTCSLYYHVATHNIIAVICRHTHTQSSKQGTRGRTVRVSVSTSTSTCCRSCGSSTQHYTFLLSLLPKLEEARVVLVGYSWAPCPCPCSVAKYDSPNPLSPPREAVRLRRSVDLSFGFGFGPATCYALWSIYGRMAALVVLGENRTVSE